ncbi:MAG: OmpA family protein [Myxococcales bacterium]|nr:OmpA family protein [Myxococcales bacterium]
MAERPASTPAVTICRGTDRCPESAEDLDKFEDDDGCPDLDNDDGGIPDLRDACALEPEDADGTLDDDGCPDPDDDADGICDPWIQDRQQQLVYEALCKGVDRCPKVGETVNEIDDEDGCPDELAHVEGNRIIIKDNIYFFSGKAVIMPKSDAVLAAVLKIMNTNPQIKRVRIEGHTDTRGPSGRNKSLSASRARQCSSISSSGVSHPVGSSPKVSARAPRSRPRRRRKPSSNRTAGSSSRSWTSSDKTRGRPTCSASGGSATGPSWRVGASGRDRRAAAFMGAGPLVQRLLSEAAWYVTSPFSVTMTSSRPASESS